jgi:hypothetical protein
MDHGHPNVEIDFSALLRKIGMTGYCQEYVALDGDGSRKRIFLSDLAIYDISSGNLGQLNDFIFS